MGWNGSDRKGTAPAQPKVTAKKPSPIRGLIAGLVVVLAAAVCYFAFFSKSEKPAAKKAEKKPTAIKEVAPAAAPKTNTVAEIKKIPVRERYDHNLYYRDEMGVLRYKTGCRAPDPWAKKGKVFDASKLEPPRVFSNASDQAICALLTRNPGSSFTDDNNYYDPEFAQEFQRSLLEPVKPNENDDEHTRNLKNAVADVKKEIVQRIKAGENLGDIMSDARDEFVRLKRYKDSLENQVSEAIEKSEYTTDDVKDLVKAANEMFEKEGLAPIEADGFITWNLRLAAERKGEDPDAAEAAYEEQKKAEQEKAEQEGADKQ